MVTRLQRELLDAITDATTASNVCSEGRTPPPVGPEARGTTTKVKFNEGVVAMRPRGRC